MVEWAQIWQRRLLLPPCANIASEDLRTSTRNRLAERPSPEHRPEELPKFDLGRQAGGNLVARRYQRNPSVVYREIAGEAILVPIHRQVTDMQSIYTMNSVGAAIWNLLDGERTLVEIRDALLVEYDVRPEDLAEDLDEFIAQLVSVGAVRAV